MTQEKMQEQEPLEARAARLARELLIVDGHIDLPYRLWEGRDESGALTEDIGQRTEKGDFDLPRAEAGGLDAPFLAIYVSPKLAAEPGASKAQADALIDLVEGLVAAHPERMALARSPDEVEERFAQGKLATLLGIENGSALEDDLANLEHFHDRGVRYVTLTHSKNNRIGDSSYEEPEERLHHGLSEFGVAVVKEMNRLGLMVDVSHVSDETLRAVLEVAEAPVIASHSGLRHFTPGFERNLDDEGVKGIAAGGGIVMVNFGSMFVSEAAQKASEARWKAGDTYAEAQGLSWKEEEERAKIEAYLDEHHPRVDATLAQVVDHIDRVVALAGVDHVGLGSDYDGVGPGVPVGLEDASRYPALIAELLRRGYTEPQVAQICSGNLMRVWRAVEAHAASGK
ncbi:MAG: dipeptidase [Deltaproteobacteria bacterium]|nr:dipeptidase [Deltaproteobacteria bacterium]